MRMNEKLRESLPRLLPVVLTLPDDQHFEFESSGDELQFQCRTQEAVASLRRCFPGAVWKKSYTDDEQCRWWEYHSVWQGIKLVIYACKEAPPTCRQITTTVEVEEEVPTAWETRRVQKEVVTWDCGGEDAAEAAENDR